MSQKGVSGGVFHGANEGLQVATAVATLSAPAATDFWSHADRSGGANACWLWSGHVAGKGYGYFRHRRAHRVAFELARGPVPTGMVLDHTCRNRICVNPAHLEPVTNRENVLRGNHPNAVAHRTNTCKRGHSLADARVRAKGRDCRVCHNEREQVRRKAARLAAAGGVA